jgi:hypothetical protein
MSTPDQFRLRAKEEVLLAETAPTKTQKAIHIRRARSFFTLAHFGEGYTHNPKMFEPAPPPASDVKPKRPREKRDEKPQRFPWN